MFFYFVGIENTKKIFEALGPLVLALEAAENPDFQTHLAGFGC